MSFPHGLSWRVSETPLFPIDLAQAVEQTRLRLELAPGQRVVVAMSGGVDSSVVAGLLHRAGCEVIGVSMQLFRKEEAGAEGGGSGRCCSLDDFQDARRVAHRAELRDLLAPLLCGRARAELA